MRILHVFRTPHGGLFRHIRDLARGQSEMGHEVGFLCDSEAVVGNAQKLLEMSKQHCSLGQVRLPIARSPGFGDLKAIKLATKLIDEIKPDVLHGHGAKGGLLARVAGKRLGIPSTYTPHGGSLQYSWKQPIGAISFITEKYLNRIGNGLCFVCEYERNEFDRKVGINGKPYLVAYNGLWPEEFKQAKPRADATDFVYLGELRPVKGIDVLLRACAKLPSATLTIAGDGPVEADLKKLSSELGLDSRVRFFGYTPMAEAVTMGRIMVMPSRFEAFPYVALEAAAAGLPLITTPVGGIPEIAPRDILVPADDVEALSSRMKQLLDDPALRANYGKAFTDQVRAKCDAHEMCSKITDFYSQIGAKS